TGAATLIYAILPQLVWTQRLSLSENPTSAFLFLAAIAALQARKSAEAHAFHFQAFERYAIVFWITCMWIRGDLILSFPLVAVLQLLCFPKLRHINLIGSALFITWSFQAWTCYPYLTDELNRIYPLSWTRVELILAGSLGVGLWLALARWRSRNSDFSLFHRNVQASRILILLALGILVAGIVASIR